MAFDAFLAERATNYLNSKNVKFEEKKMMGGLCYMVDDKMCFGVMKDSIMARIGPDFYTSALDMKGVEKMEFTGREMKGFVTVKPESLDMETDLAYWIDACLKFNPKAKSSKSKP